MDLTNCSSIYATDLLITVTPASPCDASFIPWIVFNIVFLVLSTWTLVERIKLHRKRGRNRAFPLMIILTALTTLMYVLFLILPFFQVNAINGGFILLLAWLSLLFTGKMCLLTFKLIKLGHKIIPVRLEHIGSELGKFDRPIIILFVLIAILSLVLFIVDAILVFVIPSMNQIWLGVGFVIEAAKILLLSSVILHQIQRCVNVMKLSFLNTKTMVDPMMASKLARATQVLQIQQAIVLFFGAAAVTFFGLLTAFVIPRSYITALIAIGLEAFCNFFFVLSTKRKERGNGASERTSAQLGARVLE